MKRSSKWPALRRKFLKENKCCAICSKTKNLEVHHITPIHIAPELELVETNLIVLCESPQMDCHLVWGHFYNYRLYNINIVNHSKLLHSLLSPMLNLSDGTKARTPRKGKSKA